MDKVLKTRSLYISEILVDQGQHTIGKQGSLRDMRSMSTDGNWNAHAQSPYQG